MSRRRLRRPLFAVNQATARRPRFVLFAVYRSRCTVRPGDTLKTSQGWDPRLQSRGNGRPLHCIAIYAIAILRCRALNHRCRTLRKKTKRISATAHPANVQPVMCSRQMFSQLLRIQLIRIPLIRIPLIRIPLTSQDVLIPIKSVRLRHVSTGTKNAVTKRGPNRQENIQAQTAYPAANPLSLRFHTEPSDHPAFVIRL